MDKKVKVDLKDLNVQSFVTSLEDEEKSKVKGGWATFPLTRCVPICTDEC